MKKLKFNDRLNNMSLRTRLLSHSIIFFIIPIALISIISYTLSFNAIRDRALQFSMITIDRMSYEIDELFLESYKISEMISNEPTVQETLRRELDDDISKRYSLDLKTDTSLNFMQSYKREFFGFYVVGENGGTYKSNYCSTKSGDFRRSHWYKKTIQANGPVCFGSHVDSFVVETVGQSFISIGIPIRDKVSGLILGVALIDIEENVFMNKIKNKSMGENGYMFIIDDNDNEILSSNSSEVHNLLENFNNNEKTTNQYNIDYFQNKVGGKSIIMFKPYALADWKIGAIVPIDEVTRDSKEIGLTIAIVFLIICIFAIVASWYTSNKIVNPIHNLMHLMKKVEEGDLLVSMNVKHDDEIGKLGRSFNIMIEKLKVLIDSVYREQKKLKKAELKILQAQINPHFLYNTLDSIIWMSRSNRNEEVVEMVTALTKLFRIALSKGRDVIYIEEETEHIKSYLTIQHIRYKNKFTYSIDIDENLYKFKTIKLILQPIVENAIYHGVKEKRGIGHISIIGKEEENYITFSVEDNGKGMTEEQLVALNNTIDNNDGIKMNSFGVKNVHERVQIYFGPSYGLKFYSENEIGTRVEIMIPKILEVDESVKGSFS